jgi:hypothetical protein
MNALRKPGIRCFAVANPRYTDLFTQAGLGGTVLLEVDSSVYLKEAR